MAAANVKTNSVARGIRIAILALLWLVPLALFSFAFHSGWRSVWAEVGVPAEELPFPDLRSITGALETIHQHSDPYVANPGDPWQRPLNYPRVWLGLFSMAGINAGDVPAVGIAFCGLYLLCISALIIRCKHNLDAAILMAAALSLAPLYAMELGNTDLLVFSIVFLGCIVESKVWKAGAFSAAAILKIYPLVALPIEAVLLPPKARHAGKQRLAFYLLTILVLALFAWQWRDLNAIRHSTPVSNRMAYGTLAMKEQIQEEWSGLPSLRPAAGWAVIAGCWLVGGLAVFAASRNRSSLGQAIRNSPSGELFSIFAAVYVFSFAIGSNWDYRLIFLLPTLPLAFELARNPALRRWAIVYIASLLLAVNPLDLKQTYGTALSHLITFLIFLMVLAALTQQLRSRPSHEVE